MRLSRLALLLLLSALAEPALAQSEPAYRNLDANGVDLTHGDSVLSFTEAVAGGGRSALELTRIRGGRRNFSSWDHLTFRRTQAFSAILITVGNGVTTELFSGPNLSPRNGNGAIIAGSGGSYTHTASNGTMTVFGDPSNGAGSNFCNSQTPSNSTCILVPTSITSPDGRTVNLEWELHAVGAIYYFRLDEITNSQGYEVNFAYENNSPTPNIAPPDAWYERTGATLSNSARSETIGTVGYASVTGATEVTDMANRTWRLVGGTGNLTAIRRPGESTDSIAITYSGSTVSSATRDGVTTSYSRSVSGTTATTTVTDALSGQTVVTSDMTVGRPTQVVDQLNRTAAFQYDSFGRLQRATAPLGNYVQYTYDGRGNVTETRQVAQSGSGLADIVTSASFDTTCSNPLTCNQPNSTTDARGNVTEYTYDATHGGVLTVTGPEPTTGATRPQTRYSYTQLNGEYLPTGVSACASGSVPSCVGTSAESRTVMGYDSNANMTSIQRRDGTGALSATTTITYTAAGDVETVDGPLSGSDDTTRYRYNAARQPVGEIGPDPDGTGTLPHRARRITYASNALPTLVEHGTVTSQSDSAWAQFNALEGVATEYDSNLRPRFRRLVSGSTTHALSQNGYDALGRVRCVAQRMDPADFASPPTDACAPETGGPYGADRITRTTYDAASQATLVQTGYGITGVEADEVATSWTTNGRTATLTDGNGNVTTYDYDGHDRLSRTCYPGAGTCPSPNTPSDYEELSYDANGNVSGRRLRDGTSIAYAYDALNRLILTNRPGSELDASYTYDLLNRMLTAGSSAQTVAVDFDALGRSVYQYGPQGTAWYQYDLAGRRTRLTYPGSGLYVDYDHLVTGEVIAIRENGATSGLGVLGAYTYDNLGRRTLLTRGNGTTTGYSYDSASRLSQLVQDFSGTSGDLTLGFGYNPAAQITSNTRSNDQYSYTARTNGAVADTINGLNQVTSTGGISVGYGDSRGNITAIGSANYGYSSENMMTSAPGSVSLAYDPLNRLYQMAGSATTRFVYDGDAIIAEYDGSNALQHRYVHGPGIDEPLVWYEGSGTSTRRWYHSDERGSVIAVSNSSGAVTNVNAYNEYGIPSTGGTAGTLAGQFGYTGQMWLPEFGLWFYRNRIYNPGLGRFMQADPIGYEAGMNLYGYVSGDPINLTDPYGLEQDDQLITVTGTRCDNTCRFARELDILRERERASRDGGRGDRERSDGGNDNEEAIVVTGQRIRPFGPAGQITVISASNLLQHFLRGGGENICLTPHNLITWREIQLRSAVESHCLVVIIDKT